MAYRIAVVGGDGIGPEVTAEALKVVRASGVEIDTVEFELGGARYLDDGEILSDETLEELRAFDAILLGAVGDPRVPPGVIERGLLLKMRFELDLYVNQRPFIGTAPGHSRPHDFVVMAFKVLLTTFMSSEFRSVYRDNGSQTGFASVFAGFTVSTSSYPST